MHVYYIVYKKAREKIVNKLTTHEGCSEFLKYPVCSFFFSDKRTRVFNTLAESLIVVSFSHRRSSVFPFVCELLTFFTSSPKQLITF